VKRRLTLHRSQKRQTFDSPRILMADRSTAPSLDLLSPMHRIRPMEHGSNGFLALYRDSELAFRI